MAVLNDWDKEQELGLLGQQPEPMPLRQEPTGLTNATALTGTVNFEWPG